MRTNSKCTCVSMVTKHAFLADFSTIKNVLRTHTGGLHTGSSVDRRVGPAHIFNTSMQHRTRSPAG
jgi:hypothetical protein